MRFVFSILMTAACYIAFPLIFGFTRKKPLSDGKFRCICLGVNAVFCLGIQILSSAYYEDYHMNFVPAVLWSAIGIAIGQSIYHKRHPASADKPDSTSDDGGRSSDNRSFDTTVSDYTPPEASSQEKSSVSASPEITHSVQETITPPANVNEPIYLMERDDGVLVRVPASKLDQFDPHNTEPTEKHRQMAREIVDYLTENYGKTDDSVNNSARTTGLTAGETSYSSPKITKPPSRPDTSTSKKGVPVWIVVVLLIIIAALVALLLVFESHKTNKGPVSTALPTPTPAVTLTPKQTDPTPAQATSTIALHKAKSGSIYTFPNEECIVPFVVTAPEDHDCYVRLHSRSYPENDISFYILAGDTIRKSVPKGTYDLYYAIGLDWQGSAAKNNMVFGPDTVWYASKSALAFSAIGSIAYEKTLSLSSQIERTNFSNVINVSELPF